VRGRKKGVLPLAVEKQVLDAVKICLDNEWYVGKEELETILNDSDQGGQETKQFAEFMQVVAEKLKINIKS